jgi:hypothetical protein
MYDGKTAAALELPMVVVLEFNGQIWFMESLLVSSSFAGRACSIADKRVLAVRRVGV